MLPVAVAVSMSYDLFQKKFRAILAAVGEDPKGFSTHSMRRGGATELRARELPEELIAQHGGWKSEKSMRKYFDGAVEFTRRAAALQKAEADGQACQAHTVADVDCLEED